jgi:hypothetical protein
MESSAKPKYDSVGIAEHHAWQRKLRFTHDVHSCRYCAAVVISSTDLDVLLNNDTVRSNVILASSWAAARAAGEDGCSLFRLFTDRERTVNDQEKMYGRFDWVTNTLRYFDPHSGRLADWPFLSARSSLSRLGEI